MLCRKNFPQRLQSDIVQNAIRGNIKAIWDYVKNLKQSSNVLTAVITNNSFFLEPINFFLFTVLAFFIYFSERTKECF